MGFEDLILRSIAGILFMLGLGYYTITNLQWYNYSFSRVITKHHKWEWHIYYFLIPLFVFGVAYYFSDAISFLALACVYIILLIKWAYKLDHKLKLTNKVLRFFAIYVIFLIFSEIVYEVGNLRFWIIYPSSLIFSFIVWGVYEKVLFNSYYKLSVDKLNRLRPTLDIVTITGSYGKTSMKNFLKQILDKKYKVYATPRSVNTFKGLVGDINENLAYDTQIYITEAGARQKGDIEQIAKLLNPKYALIGEIGAQHIEYFKSIENIIETKFELLKSENLKKAFYYFLSKPPKHIKVKSSILVPFGSEISDVTANLEGTSFTMEINGIKERFETNILGEFNVVNLAGCVRIAMELKMSIDEIKKAIKELKSVEHRLQKISQTPKFIIDDGFNGNLNGMLEAIRLSSLYKGRKIIVTPGLIESNDDMNKTLAQAIDRVFDIAIITGALNNKILSRHISKAQKILLEDKDQLENMLKSCSKEGDLVIFCSDAPNYI